MRTPLLLILTLMLVTVHLPAQDNKASVLLSSAIYEEEVSGNLDKAVELCLNILKLYPDDRPVAAKALYHLGLVNEKMGKQQADEYFTQLVNTYPDQKELVALARSRLSRISSASKEATLKAEQFFKKAGDLFKQADYVSAATEYGKVIALVPKTQLAQEAQLWTGQCYFNTGNYSKALVTFNSIQKEFPQSNIIPVTELMVSQVKMAMIHESKKKPVITLDEKTILDPATGIRYTKVHTWAGRNDIITEASSITGVSPERKFLLMGSQVFPFDNIDPFFLSEPGSPEWICSRLSPDGTAIAYATERSGSVIPVSTGTGRPTGPPETLVHFDHFEGNWNWSPDGEKLIFPYSAENNKRSIRTFSIKGHTTEQITGFYTNTHFDDPVFSRNGSNILYLNQSILEMRPASERKSVIILDSCPERFILSPDNQWILYQHLAGKNNLLRLKDKEERTLPAPKEAGDFIAWANPGSKVYFYSTSYEVENLIKVISIFGGPPLEFGEQFGQEPVSWTPNSNGLITRRIETEKESLNIIDLTNQESRLIAGMPDFDSVCFSGDNTKILLRNLQQPDEGCLSIAPVSLKDCKLTGEPVKILEGAYPNPGYFSWSPNSKKVAICNAGEVWIANAEGGPGIQLTETAAQESRPKWSPDGVHLAVNRQSTQLLILTVNDGQVIKTINNVQSYDWTPSGAEIIIAFDDGQLSSFTLASGQNRMISKWKQAGSNSNCPDLVCSPDGKWICLNISVYNSGAQNTRIFLLNMVEGKMVELDSEDSRNKKGMIWSPDSKWIAFASYGTRRKRMESILWEADLNDFMNKMEPPMEDGFTTDFDFSTSSVPPGGIAPDGAFTDARDGHVYPYKRYGTQIWMTENLAWLPEVSPDSISSVVDKHYYVYGYSGSVVQEAKKTVYYKTYGVLYNWSSIIDGGADYNVVPGRFQGVCPEGWHVPGDAEWMALERTLGMEEGDLGKINPARRLSGGLCQKLKAPSGWEDDNILVGQSGFNSLPGGFLGFYKTFSFCGHAGYFWTSTPYDHRIYTRFIITGKPGFFRSPFFHKEWGLSIRCVKDN